MRQLVKTPRAEADILEIWSYIAEDSEKNADAFIDRLDETFRNIAHQPGMGRARDELAPGVHSFPVGNYVIFYLLKKDIINVVRVLHGARDIEALFS